MITQAPHRSAMAVAGLFVLACVGLIIYVWTQFGGSLPLHPKGYRFHAGFTQASELVARADVRMAGVNVGRVVAVRRRGLRADATIELDARYAPLSSDARAILRQKTLLGETFVALTPGSARAPKLPEGGRLADSRIADTQQLDTVLGTFDASTQRNLRRMLQGLSTALQGRGADLNSALGNLDPAVGSFADVASIVDRQRSSFRRVIRDTGVVLQTLGDRRADLATLVGAGDRVLSSTAARNRKLTATVRALPPFLDQLRSTLRVLDATGARAAPTLAALRPAAPLLRPALSELIALSPAIRGLMREIGPVIDLSQRALPAATRLVSATVPFIDQLEAAADQVTPAVELTQLYGPTMTTVLANLGAAYQAKTQLADGTMIHYLRTLLAFSNESNVGTATQRPGSNRHNAYPAPGVLDAVGKDGIAASDCANVNNPTPVPGAGPPCHVQPPLRFGARPTYYPRLEPLPPGR
jgi:phospholipid/cholesterol/gamma-HCH transport system substrate-binding protein